MLSSTAQDSCPAPLFNPGQTERAPEGSSRDTPGWAAARPAQLPKPKARHSCASDTPGVHSAQLGATGLSRDLSKDILHPHPDGSRRQANIYLRWFLQKGSAGEAAVGGEGKHRRLLCLRSSFWTEARGSSLWDVLQCTPTPKAVAGPHGGQGMQSGGAQQWCSQGKERERKKSTGNTQSSLGNQSLRILAEQSLRRASSPAQITSLLCKPYQL